MARTVTYTCDNSGCENAVKYDLLTKAKQGNTVYTADFRHTCSKHVSENAAEVTNLAVSRVAEFAKMEARQAGKSVQRGSTENMQFYCVEIRPHNDNDKES